MITFTIIPRAKNAQEREEFFKSLKYSHSGETHFETLDENEDAATHAAFDSLIHITLPDNCIVLNNSWDKYIVHALENGLPQYGMGKNYVPNWENYVQAKMGLQARDQSGVFPDLKVELATL